MVVRVISSSRADGGWNVCQQGDELVQIGPQEGFPAGDAELVHAKPGEDGGQPANLLESEEFFFIEEVIAFAEYFRGHAVGTTEITPVGDRYAEISDWPSKLVD